MTHITPGSRAFVGDASDGYDGWQDAEVEVLGIEETGLEAPNHELATVRHTATGEQTQMFSWRLEPIIDLNEPEPEEPAEASAATEEDDDLGVDWDSMMEAFEALLSGGDPAEGAPVEAKVMTEFDPNDFEDPSADYSDIDDITAEPEDTDVTRNDTERLVSPGLLHAVISTLVPGEIVEVAQANPRVFMSANGKNDIVYLRPGDTVRVVGVENSAGFYMEGRTVLVQRRDGMTQYVDVSSLQPHTPEQQERVTEAFEAYHGGDAEAMSRELQESEQRRDAALIRLLLGDDEAATEKQMSEDFARLLYEAEAGDEVSESDVEAVVSTIAKAASELEAVEAALPTAPVARRLSLLAIARDAAREVTPKPEPSLVLDIARFLADGESG